MISNKPSIVASFALLQLQAVSAWRDYPKDLGWPEDNCCRLYRHMEFRSRPEAQWPEGEYDWVDFCTNSEDSPKVIELGNEEYMHLTLDNEVQSYKCGSETSIRFCRNRDMSKCDEFWHGESGAGGSSSQDIGVHDKHSTVVLTNYESEKRFAATVFSMDQCHGH